MKSKTAAYILAVTLSGCVSIEDWNAKCDPDNWDQTNFLEETAFSKRFSQAKDAIDSKLTQIEDTFKNGKARPFSNQPFWFPGWTNSAGIPKTIRETPLYNHGSNYVQCVEGPNDDVHCAVHVYESFDKPSSHEVVAERRSFKNVPTRDLHLRNILWDFEYVVTPIADVGGPCKINWNTKHGTEAKSNIQGDLKSGYSCERNRCENLTIQARNRMLDLLKQYEN